MKGHLVHSNVLAPLSRRRLVGKFKKPSFFFRKKRIFSQLPTHHAVDAELVSGELRHEGPVLRVPDSDGGQVAALARHQVPPVLGEAHAGHRLAGGVGHVLLTVLARVVQHHNASVKQTIEHNFYSTTAVCPKKEQD